MTVTTCLSLSIRCLLSHSKQRNPRNLRGFSLPISSNGSRGLPVLEALSYDVEPRTTVTTWVGDTQGDSVKGGFDVI